MNLKIEKDVLLSKHTTLHVGGVADFFVEVKDKDELVEALLFAKQMTVPLFVLGGGSNVLVRDDGCRGLVIKNSTKGISYTVHGDSVYVSSKSGEILDELVADTVAKNYWGLENLSSIPGTVGATPIQNVGAYGVEVSSLITEVSAINIETEEVKIFSNADCQFSYRNSFFKTPAGRKWIITEVVYKLSMLKNPQLNYGSLKDLSSAKKITLEEIRKEIIKIRSTKFPNYNKVGTAGSFFKNPIIPNEQFITLQAKYPDLPGYYVDENTTKISLGWILDNVCELRGFCRDGVCLYKEQALVLVNETAKKSSTINNFADYIAEQVREKTGIVIAREVTDV